MVFKPFKSPLIRNSASSTENLEEPTRPTKKPRLEEEPVPDDAQSTTAIASRKPLLQVSNRGPDSATQSSSADSSKHDTDTSDERYFNVLW